MFPSYPLCLCENYMNFSHEETKDTAMIAMFLGVPKRSQKLSRMNLMSFSLTNVKISDVVVFITISYSMVMNRDSDALPTLDQFLQKFLRRHSGNA